jgi:hypothetical protein
MAIAFCNRNSIILIRRFLTRSSFTLIARIAGLLMVLTTSQIAQAHLDLFSKEIDVRIDAGYMYDDNVTRANEPVDILSDHAVSANISAVVMFALGEHARAIVTAAVGGQKFNQYHGLNQATESAQGELQYRGSADFGAPTYGVFLRTFADQYESGLRSGSRYSAGVSARLPVTDRIQVFGAVAHNQRYGNSAVFNIMDNSARINLDYALSRRGTMYLGAEMRNGDIVSTGQPSLENIDISYVFAPDVAFPGMGLYSYRFKGNTSLYTLGYNYGLSSRSSLDLSWRMVVSAADGRPSFATSPASYTVNQYSFVYLFAF